MKINKKLDKIISIKDVVYKEIIVEYKIIKEIIDSFEFQRLRRINQLSFTNYVFQNANHTRFSHSLGTYAIAREIINKDDFKLIKEEEKIIFMICALLHDLGHGPFSHSFENIINYDHEEFTKKIITSQETQINKILSKYKIVNKVIKSFNKKDSINKLISSSIDVDRMDYLLRDAYFTGSKLGNYEFYQFKKGITFYKGEFVYKEKYLSSLESFFIARHHMHKDVYHHKTSEMFEAMLVLFFNQIMKNINNLDFNLENFSFLTKNKITVKELLKIDDYDVWNLIKKSSNSNIKDVQIISKKILNRQKINKELYSLKKLKKIKNKNFIVVNQKYKNNKIDIKLINENNKKQSIISKSSIIKNTTKDNKKNKYIYYI